MKTTPRRAYPTDLNDKQWTRLAPLFPIPRSTRGRPRTWAYREIVNAIFYIVRSGEAWRLLPHDFPPWQTVYGYYWQWRNSGLWDTLNTTLVPAVRQQAGRHPQPSAASIDSQSVKTAEGGEERGVDVHKQVSGRKRHIVVDVLGLVLLVVVHSAGIPDGTGGKLVLATLCGRIKRTVYNRWCRLKLLWADGAYEDIVPWVKQTCGWTLEITRRPPDAKGFVVIPRRWVVERTFGWLGRYRRLSKDFEHQVRSSEAMVYLANIHRMLRLLDG
jgi:putative transposase